MNITDYNQRNTHMVLDHLEHNIVLIPPKDTSFLATTDKILHIPSSDTTDMLVSVLDFDQAKSSNLVSKAKYSIDSRMHHLYGNNSSTWTFDRRKRQF